MKLKTGQKLSPLRSRKADIHEAQNRYMHEGLETLASVSWFKNTLISHNQELKITNSNKCRVAPRDEL